jgi:putative ABC transport system permease protein
MSANAPVAVVSRSVARLLNPGEDVLGQRVSVWGRQNWLTIVGVVDDVKQFGPTEPAHPAIYTTYLQPRNTFFLSHMTYVVRAKSDPLAVVPAIREVLRSVDRNQPAASIALMSDIVARTRADSGFQARLLSVFAFLAVALALIGTYGVLTYSVSQRTHEIGVRMALGADWRELLWMVIRRTMLLGIAGVAIGLGGAWVATRLLTTLLFETAPTDPATFGVVAVAVFTAAVIAGFVPARRATRIDPLVALRHE